MPRPQNPRHQHCGEDPSSLGLDKLSLIDRARALCAAADDVQKATIEASRRIAAIHGDSPNRQRRNERNKKAKKQTVQEPPDICARPPSDIPPPRGEGWRRIGEVAVVRGSNRLSAPSHARRALVRHVDVFVGGGQYSVVPADIEPGGGFCVTLNRDFEGETNMACMLYMRKRGGGGGEGEGEGGSGVARAAQGVDRKLEMSESTDETVRKKDSQLKLPAEVGMYTGPLREFVLAVGTVFFHTCRPGVLLTSVDLN